MKAITLTQPWATLVAIGSKRIETRSWSTHYRGLLAIHAAKSFPRDAAYLCFQKPFREILLTQYGFMQEGEIFFGKHKFPLGCVIATCTLINVVQFGAMPVWVDPTGKEQILDKWPHEDWLCIPPDGDTPEYAFGDYTMGRCAWLLADIRPLPEPVPARGSLGLWNWDEQGYIR